MEDKFLTTYTVMSSFLAEDRRDELAAMHVPAIYVDMDSALAYIATFSNNWDSPPKLYRYVTPENVVANIRKTHEKYRNVCIATYCGTLKGKVIWFAIYENKIKVQ